MRIIEREEHVDSSGRRTPADEGDKSRTTGGDRDRDRAARSASARGRHDRNGNDDQPESIADVQRELDATRARMSDVIAELDARVAGAVQAVRHRTDVIRLVRQHPWPAMASAFAAGAAIAASGTDEKAVDAAKGAAKNAPNAASGAAHAVAAGATHLVRSVKQRKTKGNGDTRDNGDPPGSRAGGIRGRIRAMLAAEAHFLGQELGRAADELVRAVAAPRRVHERPLSLPPARSSSAAPPDGPPSRG